MHGWIVVVSNIFAEKTFKEYFIPGATFCPCTISPDTQNFVHAQHDTAFIKSCLESAGSTG